PRRGGEDRRSGMGRGTGGFQCAGAGNRQRLRQVPGRTAGPELGGKEPLTARRGRMNEFLNYLLFGWYPYVALTVLFLGSILRFDKGQYSWRAQSSQFLRRRQMILGSNLFHIGVLILFVGHFVGLLTPIGVFEFLGISHTFKQMGALIVGGLAGIAALVGATLLRHRGLFDPRVRRSSSIGDILVLVLLWLQLVLGIATTFWTIG